MFHVFDDPVVGVSGYDRTSVTAFGGEVGDVLEVADELVRFEAFGCDVDQGFVFVVVVYDPSPVCYVIEVLSI